MSFNYTSNIPVSGQSLNVTKNPINSNFQAINQLIAVNHVGFNLTGLGKHNLVELVAQSAPPTTLDGEDSIFSKTTTGVTDIYYTADSGGNAYQLTSSNDATFSKFGASNPGWTMLPGGLILNYGASSSTSSGTITFATPFSAIYAIGANPTYGGSAPNGEATVAIKQGNSSFTFTFVTGSGAYNGFYWWAIGQL